jgi:hypothetical protein
LKNESYGLKRKENLRYPLRSRWSSRARNGAKFVQHDGRAGMPGAAPGAKSGLANRCVARRLVQLSGGYAPRLNRPGRIR